MPNMVLTTRRDPFATFDTVIRRAFPTSGRWTLGPIPSPTSGPAFVPAAEIVKDGDDAAIRLDLPGVDLANDVAVEVDNGRLVVRGQRRDQRTAEEGARLSSEVRYGSFRRVFTLPERLPAGAVSASYDAGVLTVRVAGAYATEVPQKIAVTIVPAAAAADSERAGVVEGQDAPAAEHTES
jgi:HSP20 family molecular chaperone IbpA